MIPSDPSFDSGQASGEGINDPWAFPTPAAQDDLAMPEPEAVVAPDRVAEPDVTATPDWTSAARGPNPWTNSGANRPRAAVPMGVDQRPSSRGGTFAWVLAVSPFLTSLVVGVLIEEQIATFDAGQAAVVFATCVMILIIATAAASALRHRRLESLAQRQGAEVVVRAVRWAPPPSGAVTVRRSIQRVLLSADRSGLSLRRAQAPLGEPDVRTVPWSDLTNLTWRPRLPPYGLTEALSIELTDAPPEVIALSSVLQQTQVDRLASLVSHYGGTVRRASLLERWLIPTTVGAALLGLTLSPLALMGIDAAARVSPIAAAISGGGGPGGVLPRGYSDTRLSQGGHLDVGHPWGPVCEPVILTAAGQPSATLVAQIERVVAEAHRAGLNVAYVPEAELPTIAPDPTKGEAVVILRVLTTTPPLNSSGHPVRYDVPGETTHNSVTGENLLSSLYADLYMQSIGNDQVLMRKIVRAVVASAMGISISSTSPGSGLNVHLANSTDAFSASDIRAMLTMSGCGR